MSVYTPLTPAIDKKEKFAKYKLEDTTGSIHCVRWADPGSSTRVDYEIGDLVVIRGKVVEFRECKEIKVFSILLIVSFLSVPPL